MATAKTELGYLKTILMSGPTIEHGLAQFKALNELNKEKTLNQVVSNMGPLGTWLETMKYYAGEEFTGKVLGGYQTVQAEYEQAKKTMSQQEATKSLNKRADQLDLLNNSGTALGYRMWLNNAFAPAVAQQIGMVFSGQPLTTTGNDWADAEARSQLRDLYNSPQLPPEIRGEVQKSYVNSYTWQQMMAHPELARDIRNDSALVQQTVGKATAYAAQFLGDPGGPDSIAYDATRPANPFYYANPVGISRERTNDILKLNTTLKYITDMFGADVAEEWVNDLVTLGVEQGGTSSGITGTLGTAKKKVSETGSRKPVPSDLEPLFKGAAESHGIPDGLLEAVAWVESRYNTNAKGPVLDKGDRASGIMQIRPTAHPGVDYFKADKAIPYAAGYLASLYEKFGDWNKALAAYNWGQGRLERIASDPNWFDRLPSSVKDYVSKVNQSASAV
jgi:hypothetical protein